LLQRKAFGAAVNNIHHHFYSSNILAHATKIKKPSVKKRWEKKLQKSTDN